MLKLQYKNFLPSALPQILHLISPVPPWIPKSMTSVYGWVWWDVSIRGEPWEKYDVEIDAFIFQSEKEAFSVLRLVTCFRVVLLMWKTLFLLSLFLKTSFSQIQLCAAVTGHWRALYSHMFSSLPASLCPISYYPMPILLYTASCASTFEACHTKPVLLYTVSLS